MAPHQSPTHRPPLDYTKRGVKLRLFACLAAIMLVAAIIETRAWKWFSTPAPNPADHGPIDNRLPDIGSRTAFDPAGTFVAQSDSKSDAQALSDDKPFDAVQRAWNQGWRDVYSRLPADQKSLLFETLDKGVLNRHDRAAELLENVEDFWSDYHTAAFQSVSELKGNDQTKWIDILRQVNERFTGEVLPALNSAAGGQQPTDVERSGLRTLQQTLVALTRAQIQDDTVVFRPAEREIWFHELGRVVGAGAASLRRQSIGRVAYLQLYKQPGDYRGQLVTVA